MIAAETAWLAKRLAIRKSTSTLGVSGALATVRENPREFLPLQQLMGMWCEFEQAGLTAMSR
jgi:hypothetical protein